MLEVLSRTRLVRSVNSFLLLVNDSDPRHRKLLLRDILLRVVSLDVKELLPDVMFEDVASGEMTSKTRVSRIDLTVHLKRRASEEGGYARGVEEKFWE